MKVYEGIEDELSEKLLERVAIQKSLVELESELYRGFEARAPEFTEPDGETGATVVRKNGIVLATVMFTMVASEWKITTVLW